MEQSLKINADELTTPLIEGLKKFFRAVDAKDITINFSIPGSHSTTKKKYLYEETQEEANARIEQSVKDMENGDFVFFTGEEFEQMTKALSTRRR